MNFLYGSYGIDLLSLLLIVLSTLLNVNRYTSILSFIILSFSIYRIFSKNIYKRTLELNKFIKFVNIILGKLNKKLPTNLNRIPLTIFTLKFKKFKNYIIQKRKFKIVNCPKCNQKLRLPRKKGSITVICKKCSYEFPLRT